MFEPGNRVGVAVSGGADSVFLLHALAGLAPRWDLNLSVLHLDHRLRGAESRGDADFVRELAGRLKLPVHLADCDVAQLQNETGDNLEQTARKARRLFYLGFVRRNELDRVATGHTRSDQAETVLFRFLRGSGTAGLSGIRPVTSEGLVRPLIDLERVDIERYLREGGIAWREDSTNASHDFARNRIRHELLPQLIQRWNPALVENLAQTAQWAQDEEAYWDAEIDRLATSLLTVRPSGVLVRAGDLCALPPAVARRVARRAIELTKGDLRGIDFHHVTRILEVAEAPEGHARMQAPGLDVCRSFDMLRIAPPGIDADFQMPVSIPGRFALPDSGSTVGLEFVQQGAGLDGELMKDGLELRNWRPGDRYRPVGRAGEEKIKVLFQEARIPIWERRTWPVLTVADHIVWSRRFGLALPYAATAHSRLVVKVWEEAADVPGT